LDRPSLRLLDAVQRDHGSRAMAEANVLGWSAHGWNIDIGFRTELFAASTAFGYGTWWAGVVGGVHAVGS